MRWQLRLPVAAGIRRTPQEDSPQNFRMQRPLCSSPYLHLALFHIRQVYRTNTMLHSRCHTIYLRVKLPKFRQLYSLQTHQSPGAPSDPLSMSTHLGDAQGLIKAWPDARCESVTFSQGTRCVFEGGLTSFSYAYVAGKKIRRELTSRKWCASSTQPFEEL